MYTDKELDVFEQEIESNFKELSEETLQKLNKYANFAIIHKQSSEIILAIEGQSYLLASSSWYSFYQRLSDFYTGYLEGLLISKGVNL